MLTTRFKDDILKARLKTLGVTEYRFKMKAAGNAMNHDWRVYDVGGQRSLVREILNTDNLSYADENQSFVYIDALELPSEVW